jgi:hypothetical protein
MSVTDDDDDGLCSPLGILGSLFRGARWRTRPRIRDCDRSKLEGRGQLGGKEVLRMLAVEIEAVVGAVVGGDDGRREDVVGG